MKAVESNIKKHDRNLEMSEVMDLSYTDKVVDYAMGGYTIFTQLQSGRVMEIPVQEFAAYLNTDMPTVLADMMDESNVLDYSHELQLYIRYCQELVIYNDDPYNDPEYELESLRD